MNNKHEKVSPQQRDRIALIHLQVAHMLLQKRVIEIEQKIKNEGDKNGRKES
jgi:hypothetical protein